jgi:hypothetical protein
MMSACYTELPVVVISQARALVLEQGDSKCIETLLVSDIHGSYYLASQWNYNEEDGQLRIRDLVKYYDVNSSVDAKTHMDQRSLPSLLNRESFRLKQWIVDELIAWSHKPCNVPYYSLLEPIDEHKVGSCDVESIP